tara:strand:- start:50344 stop:51441 length:1098 start_codon:yes stop_codon:yes gene_type:complete
MPIDRRTFNLAAASTLGAMALSPVATGATGMNKRIVLASRPVGKPTLDNFRIEDVAIPEIADGQVMLKTRYLSLDPYMRGRMSAAESYAPPVELDHVMVGGTVSEVIESRNSSFQKGDLVTAFSGWQSYDISSGQDIRKLDPRITRPSFALGVLGMPGLTAYVGLMDIGEPKAGETVVLAASTGAVGSVVGQLAKSRGCRVVGIAGAKVKCDYAVKELGYDACISHYDADMAAQLKALCPDGIDIYFENVGGSSWEAVMPLLNNHARVPVCGLIAHYNQTSLPPGPDRMVMLQSLILRKSLRMQGFIVSNYLDRAPAMVQEVGALLASGKMRYKEDVVEGLVNAPEAFQGLFRGANFGKLVVKVS